MKIMVFALIALATSSVEASAITVTTPVNGAQVTSPFSLVASTSTCGGVPTVSMGYSLDSGPAVIKPASFSAMASASPGAHVLHVKCWGQQTNAQVLLNITVVQAAATSNITVTSPANGAKVLSPFTLAAGVTTCKGVPALSMGYSIDGASATAEPISFSTKVTKNLGAHTVVVKCYGLNVQDSVSLSVDVAPPPTAATPQFSLATGTYASKQSVTLYDASAGANIYYTTDGSSPTTLSAQYAGPISVASSTVIEAMAGGPGFSNSGLARASYSIVLPTKPTVPSNAIQVSQIQTLPGWRTKFDPGTGGTAEGAMSLVSSPSLSGQTAQYDTSYSNYGGVLYSVTYDHDQNATNFVYDAEVWIEAGSEIGNLEMDNNQALSNGDTIIYAFQCAGDSNTWDYTRNAGTPTSPIVQWVHSTALCNPASWTTNTWHHVQVSYSRDDSGNVTYQSVWLDGAQTAINATVMSEFALSWAPGTLVTNFQVDGLPGSGSSTLYLDNLTISRW